MNWPFENNTNDVVRKLAGRSLQSEKRRNIMVFISVLLASFLITFAFGLGFSLIRLQNNQVAETYEAVFSNITEPDIEALRKLPEISLAGGYYLIGSESSEHGYTGSFVYADEAMMYIGRRQMALAEGRMPVSADEIAATGSWIKEYEPEAGIGDRVTLDTETFHGTYTVSGIIDAPETEGSQTFGFIVSEELLRQHTNYRTSGYRAYIHLNNDMEMTEKEIKDLCSTIAEENNLPSPSYNTQYFTWVHGGIHAESASAVLLLAGLVLIGGYVVIQSIFRISITEKIRSFGQLRTLGATKKQIHRIVRKEGVFLGWCGIASGNLLGILITFLLMPKGFYLFGYAAAAILAALICRLMVGFSLRKPVKIASGVSPVEAVRYSPGNGKLSRTRPHHTKLHPFTLGLMNFKRDRKKVISIVASLSIGGIMLLIISSMLYTYSPEMMARESFPYGDYRIHIDSNQDLKDILYQGNPLNDSLRQKILSINGVEAVLTARRSAHGSFQTQSQSGSGMCDMIQEADYETLEKSLSQGSMPSGPHQILLADTYTKYSEELRVGSVIQFGLDGESALVIVSGFFHPTKLNSTGRGHGSLQLDAAMMFLPEALFYELLPGVSNFEYSWDIVSNPSKDSAVEMALKNLDASNAEIGLTTFEDAVAYHKSAYSMLFHVLQCVALLISLFGVINLINTTLSNQISRRHEVSTLRSVGLTRKQLYKMMTCEGVCYALISILFTMLAGIPASIIIHRQLSIIVYNEIIPYTFPALYMGLYVLALLALECILSLWTIRRQGKSSLIEQLQTI